jgi:hypothetical protein
MEPLRVLDNVIVSRLDLTLLGEGNFAVEDARKRGHAAALAIGTNGAGSRSPTCRRRLHSET